MTRDEALLQALAELSILRKAVTWLIAHEAAKLDDPSVLLRAASERITQEIGRLPPADFHLRRLRLFRKALTA